MRPHTTLRNMLVHPKDKLDLKKTINCVYEIPCKSCPQSYIGETKRQFGTRLNEHKLESDKAGETTFTRSKRKESLTEMNKSAITDHVAKENHIIDWENAKILDKEENKKARWIKEAIWIRSKDNTMNRDGGRTYSVTSLIHYSRPPME